MGPGNLAPHPPGFEPWTSQFVASRCTDYAVPAVMFCVRTKQEMHFTLHHTCHRQHDELDCVAGRQLTQCTAQVVVGPAV